MMRSDEDRQTKPGLGASMARSPAAARAAESHEMGEAETGAGAGPGKGAGRKGDGASMGRSPGAARSETARDQAEQRSEQGKGHSVMEGSGIGSKTVEADNAMGEHGSVRARGAEGMADDASSKANRRENEEPERERDEKAAISRDEVRHSGTIGGERKSEVPARNIMGDGRGGMCKAHNTI